MMKKLTKHGNSLALVIETPILNILKIDEKTELSITIENRSLTITPRKNNVSVSGEQDIDKIAEKIMTKYEKVFKKLAK